MSVINCKRKDLVGVDKLESLRIVLKLSKKEMSEILGVSRNQIYHYYNEGFVPLLRYQAVVNALKLQAQEEYQARIKLIDDITNGLYDDE